MTTLTSPQSTDLPVVMGFGNLQSFEFMQRTARMFALSTMVPTAYQAVITKGYGEKATSEQNPAALSNCMIALDMAQRMNANPLMIMQNLHVIEGRPSWSSQFIIAAINNCGKFSPLRFDLEWLDEIDAFYSTFEWVDRRKVEQKHKVRLKNARCVAWAIEKATGERLASAPVTMEMAVNEGWFGKNGSKWKSMPDLMMRYRSAAFFGRIYAPELLMGLPAVEELYDVFDVRADGSVSAGGAQAAPKSMGTVQVEPQFCPDEVFEKNLPTWRKAIASGKKTADEVVATAQAKYALSDEQKAAIRAPAAEPAPKATEPEFEQKPASAPAPVPVPAPGPGPHAMTFAAVADRLAKAADRDALDMAGDLIGAVESAEQRAELAALYDERDAAMSAEDDAT